MAVDMYEFKFLRRLEELPPFQRAGGADEGVNQVPFPAWRAPFTALLLQGHSAGYRLPSYRKFFDLCRRDWSPRTYKLKGREESFSKWFEEPLVRRTELRIKGWYEGGMAETYLYVCLADAFEDVLKDGIVLYDPRVDWKQKWDAAVVTRGEKFFVNAFWGEPGGRRGVEERRDRVEKARKARTSVSSHWNNTERDRWTELRISRSDDDCQIVNGLRLFSVRSVNGLLKEIYDRAGFERDERFFFPGPREERDARRTRMFRTEAGKPRPTAAE